jgi:hypothetical protein
MRNDISEAKKQYHRAHKVLLLLLAGLPAMLKAEEEAREFWMHDKHARVRGPKEDWTPEEQSAFWLGYAYKNDDLASYMASHVAKLYSKTTLEKMEKVLSEQAGQD